MTWTSVNVSDNTLKFPAGEYYIGDPCYVLNDKDYEETAINGDGYYTDGKNMLYILSTAFGDGYYKDTKGRGYGVDSGTLSVIPTEVCEKKNICMGSIVIFKNEFTAGTTNNYKLWVTDRENPENSFEISTKGYNSDEDDEDEWNYNKNTKKSSYYLAHGGPHYCGDNECEGDCGVQSCGGCIDVCRCDSYYDRYW